MADKIPGHAFSDDKQKRKRDGKFAHWCYEWDDLLIDETDGEFMACLCYRDNINDRQAAEVKAIQDRMWEEHDKRQEGK